MAGMTGMILCAIFVYILARLIKAYSDIVRIGAVVDKLPGPPKHWLYGTLHTFPGIEKILEYNGELTAKYKTSYRTWMGPFLPMVHLVSPDTIKVVMQGGEPKLRFLATGGGYDLFIPWIGEGLITSEGPKWHRNRRLLTPAFHFGILKKYLQVHNSCADHLLRCIQKASGNSEKYMVIDELISTITLDDVLKCAFSFDENIHTGEMGNDFPQNTRDVTHLLGDRFVKPSLHNNLLYRMTKNGRLFFKKVKEVHKFADTVIAQRKRHLDEVGQDSAKVLDFLDVLLMARDTDGSGLTLQEIRDEVNSFMFAGHDTTSSAITWFFYNMASHPAIQEKVREEVQRILAGRDSDDLEWEDLSKFEYLPCCVKESLRLHSPVPIIDRRLTKQTTIDGADLLPGTLIELGIYDLHHNPHVWENPYEYDPDRFKQPLPDPFMFVPFSGGPRNCIGQNFAMNELYVMVAKTFNRYRLTCDPNHKVEPITDLVLRSKNGIKIMFEALK